ncbi:hypothetical protein [Streptomyces sp. NPDC048392]|uniref:hypothetical protein n=1 Tax=Streptomyces sp. NPDC048392 TaxID=3365543 RepID=UPI003717615F
MGEVLKRRPVLGGLAIAAFGLTVLAVSSRYLSEVVAADFPRRPVWDLGGAGPWGLVRARRRRETSCEPSRPRVTVASNG